MAKRKPKTKPINWAVIHAEHAFSREAADQ